MNPSSLQDTFADFLLDGEDILWAGKPQVTFATYRLATGLTGGYIIGMVLILSVFLALYTFSQAEDGAVRTIPGLALTTLLLATMWVVGFGIPLYIAMRRRYQKWYPHHSIYAVTNWRILFRIYGATHSVPIALLPNLYISNTPDAPKMISFGLPEALVLYSIPDSESVFRLINTVQNGYFAGRTQFINAGKDEAVSITDSFSHLLGKGETLLWTGAPKPAPPWKWAWIIDTNNTKAEHKRLSRYSYAVTDQRVMLRLDEQWNTFPLQGILSTMHIPHSMKPASISFYVLALDRENLPANTRKLSMVKSVREGVFPVFEQLNDSVKVFRLITQLQRERLIKVP